MVIGHHGSTISIHSTVGCCIALRIGPLAMVLVHAFISTTGNSAVSRMDSGAPT